jgi:hypothetical protein
VKQAVSPKTCRLLQPGITNGLDALSRFGQRPPRAWRHPGLTGRLLGPPRDPEFLPQKALQFMTRKGFAWPPHSTSGDPPRSPFGGTPKGPIPQKLRKGFSQGPIWFDYEMSCSSWTCGLRLVSSYP